MAYGQNGSRTANSVKLIFKNFGGPKSVKFLTLPHGGLTYLVGGFGLSKVNVSCHCNPASLFCASDMRDLSAISRKVKGKGNWPLRVDRPGFFWGQGWEEGWPRGVKGILN
jgi:hypothetical protein